MIRKSSIMASTFGKVLTVSPVTSTIRADTCDVCNDEGTSQTTEVCATKFKSKMLLLVLTETGKYYCFKQLHNGGCELSNSTQDFTMHP